MVHTDHPGPGRLHLDLPQLKDQPELAVRVETVIRWIEGVTSVQVDAAAGSLTVEYQSAGPRIEAIWRALRKTGLNLADISCLPVRSSPPVLTDRMAGILMCKLIERSVLPLVVR